MNFGDIELISDGGVISAQGFQAGAARAGIKTEGDDVALIASSQPCVAAGVFTRNMVKAAPVWVSAKHLEYSQHRAIVVNAGNANCCTGEQGRRDAEEMCRLAAAKIGCSPEEVLVCSTGIIGHQLPMAKVQNAISDLQLHINPVNQYFSLEHSIRTMNEACARAFMTTDTVPKFCAARTQIGGKTVTVGGQAKGVGMLGPNMGPLSSTQLHATMLSFLTTDAQVEKALLQRALEEAVERSFNSVTVDGDTSTNDTCLLLASGASGVQIGDSEYSQFVQLLQFVCAELAKKIARDGEGATKLVTVQVSGAASESDAKTIAMSIANSPLVKTAIFGADPNWGRIAMAAGKSGVSFNASKLNIQLGGIEVFRNGEPAKFDLAQAETAMQVEDLLIDVQLREGEYSWSAWTCDFSYDYVKINAEYHT